MMLLAALLASLLAPASAPMSVYETHETQVNACVRFLETGDKTAIAVDVGAGEIGHLECADYPEALEIIAARALTTP